MKELERIAKKCNGNKKNEKKLIVIISAEGRNRYGDGRSEGILWY